MTDKLQDVYNTRVAEGLLNPDPAQTAVLPMLEDIRHHLEATHLKRRGILGGLFHKPEEVPAGTFESLVLIPRDDHPAVVGRPPVEQVILSGSRGDRAVPVGEDRLGREEAEPGK